MDSDLTMSDFLSIDWNGERNQHLDNFLLATGKLIGHFPLCLWLLVCIIAVDVLCSENTYGGDDALSSHPFAAKSLRR